MTPLIEVGDYFPVPDDDSSTLPDGDWCVGICAFVSGKIKGILSAEAAERIGRPDLAGVEVEYEIPRDGLTGEVRYQGEFLAAHMRIGSGGIILVQEENREDGRENDDR